METWDVPRPVPKIMTTDTSGMDINLPASHGAVTIVYVWAMWASPAATELPQLATLQKRYQGRGLTIFALDLDAPDQLRKVAEVAKAFAPLKVVEAKDVIQAPRRLDITSLPTAIIIDKNYREIARLQGPTDWDSPAVDLFLDALLPSQPVSLN